MFDDVRDQEESNKATKEHITDVSGRLDKTKATVDKFIAKASAYL